MASFRSIFWIGSIVLCYGFIFVIAEKRPGHKSKVNLIANHTRSHHAKTTTTTEAPTQPPQTAPPPPPPPKNCDDDGKCAEKNKKCNGDQKCVCDVHFREISDGSCVEKPQLGEQCFDNITWLDCDGEGVDPNCFAVEGPNHGKCVCAKGHEPSKTDKTCTPINKKLTEPCANDAECSLAYSACIQGACACIDGFSSSDNGICKPNEIRCPSGKPKKHKGNIALCEVDFNEQTGNIGDNCGANHFCFVPPHTLTNAGKPHGHCCPTPSPPESAQLVCPFGQPLANATCYDKKGPESKKEISTCPSYSHQCFAVQARPHDMICCANPCRQSASHFNYNGQCFDYVLLGRPCELAAQCTGDAECTDAAGGGQKVCKCKKGYTQASANQCEENATR